MENDDRTRIIPDKTQGSGPPPIPGFSDDRTRKISRPVSPYGEETRRTGSVPASVPASSDKTVILGPTTRRSSSAAPPQTAAANSPKDNMSDPVVGWLAIVSGPGAGGFARLGYGMNSIGRSADQRCQLDFGDEKISRQSHASISYDPRGRKFYLQHGGGQNLSYLADAPVLQPTELLGGEFITLGDTTLRFVRLCGADFDYQDVQQAQS
jgi:hypothetical protein